MRTTHPRTNKRARLFASFACCLMTAPLAFQGACPVPIPIPIGGGGGVKANASTLAKYGPLPLGAYVISKFRSSVFLREAPMVVEYQLGNESTATITLTVKVKKKKEEFILSLEPTGTEIKEKQFRLPAKFGKEPLVGTLSVKAKNVDPKNKNPSNFMLYGLCMGEKACGSIALYDLRLRPDRVSASQNQKVTYSFYSKADFESITAEFQVQTQPAGGGDSKFTPVVSQKIPGVLRGVPMAAEWDGKDPNGKVSKGRHQLVMKGWYSPTHGGDWADVISRERVTVE